MKNVSKVLFAVLLLALATGASADDKYDQLAKDLTEAAASLQGQKIAIIPFSYADTNDADSKDGSVIAARLTVKMINMHKFDIIERSALDKVMNELKLQASGTIDAASAQQLGKVLGVQAIVTGTLVQTSDGKIEVNARMIKTETAQAIGASQVDLDKDWIGDVSKASQQPVPQQPTYQQPTYQQPAYQEPAKAASAGSKDAYGYFDVLGGVGYQTTSITWAANYAPPYGGVKQTNITTSGVGPLGFRVGGYGNGAVGGDFEFSVFKHYVDQQPTTTLNDRVYAIPIKAGFLDVTSVGLSGDLLFRTMTPVQVYLGIGLGMSINNIQSTVLRDIHNVLLNETEIGFMFRVPIGVRYNMDNTTFFAEGRAEINATSFNGGSTITNNVTFTGARFVFGVGTKF